MSRHGMVRAVGTHFEYEDGTIFYPFGTTVYALAHQKEEIIEQTFASLEDSPFNKVRMCVFPKHYSYNKNEPEYYPFEKREDGTWRVDCPSEDFWAHLEGIIRRLDDMEIECDLILFHPYDRWGFSQFSQEENLIYLDYVIKRLGHLKNIWWSLANEYDFCLAKKSMDDWREIEEFVASHDPNHHLLSNHNCFVPWDVSRKNITHASYQTKRLADIPGVVRKFGKPVMVDECCYEGNLPQFWGCLSGEEMTARFWRVVTSGGYCTHGETFLDPDDVIWWAKGGKLKGTSKERIQFLKDIVYSLPAPLEPLGEEETGIANLPEEAKKEMESLPIGESYGMAISMMEECDRHIFEALEHCYGAKCGKDAYLYYYDIRCCGRDTLVLPRDVSYKVEIIDTWNMTRETAATGVSGEVPITLPGRPYMAVLAVRE